MENRDINPWLHIWTKPKKTMQAILAKDPKRMIVWLALISGIISAYSWLGYLWTQHPETESYHNAFFVVAMLVLGGVIGIAHLYFAGWLYQLTGKWVKGEGDFTSVKCAVGWANYPLIISNIFSSIAALVASMPYLSAVFGLANIIAAVWALIIFLNLLGVAHKFSAWKALLAVLIGWVLIFVVLMLVGLIVPLIVPLFQS